MGNTLCGCHLKCFETVAESQRKRLFEGFWKTANLNIRNAYICGCVKVIEVAKRYTARGAESQRSNSRVFYVRNGRVSTRVCKAAFLAIHAISNGRLEQALKAQADLGGSPHNDQRGSHPPPNKTTEESLELVWELSWEHISSFSKYKSLYSRSDNPIEEALLEPRPFHQQNVRAVQGTLFQTGRESCERVGGVQQRYLCPMSPFLCYM